MCQPQSKGGKRCATHMHGSMAVVTHTAVVYNADEGVVRTVFRELRREGKNLPAPSQEEVRSFADEQRFRAQFDPRIEDERKRNTIMRRLSRTAEETPDGGTFHAWKNTMAETARRYSRKVAAIGTASVFAFGAAACSGGGGALENTPAPSPSSSASQAFEVPAGLELSGVTENDGKGEYARVSLSEDSPLYTYDVNVVQADATAAGFTQQDITEAQRAAAEYAVEEGLDSILVDSARTDEWYEQNQGKFTPDLQQDVKDALADKTPGASLRGLVDNDVNGARDTDNYGLVLDGGPRIENLDIKTSRVFVAPDGSLAVEYQGSVQRRAATEAGEVGYEHVNFTQTYALQKQSDGQWLISGWNNTFRYGSENTIQ